MQTKIFSDYCKGFIVAALAICAASCGSPSGEKLDTATTGSIRIAVDEGYKPIADTQIDVFQALYPQAHIKAIYTSEAEAFKLLLLDSVRMILVSRDLSDQERSEIKKQTITPRSIKIATDALAIIVNKENRDSSVLFEQLQKIFNGDFKKWSELNPASKLGDIQIVFDQQGSSTSRFVSERFNVPFESLQQRVYAAKGNEDLIDHVSRTPNAIGILGINWISDEDDPKAMSFLSKIKVLGISPPDTSKDKGKYFKPYQAYIALKQYPLTRDMMVVMRESRMGLATGFTSFINGDKGQRMLLKAALVPANAPIRIINTNK